jgi:hypothetical protein
VLFLHSEIPVVDNILRLSRWSRCCPRNLVRSQSSLSYLFHAFAYKTSNPELLLAFQYCSDVNRDQSDNTTSSGFFAALAIASRSTELLLIRDHGESWSLFGLRPVSDMHKQHLN